MISDRRIEARLLCADLVDIQWRDQNNRSRRGVANLEDISLSGACLQVERPIPLGTVMRITYPNGELTGHVKYCVFREIGYFLGVEFDPRQPMVAAKLPSAAFIGPAASDYSGDRASEERLAHAGGGPLADGQLRNAAQLAIG